MNVRINNASCFSLLCALVMSALIFCAPAKSQEIVAGKKYTESEKIGFAFYKLSKIKPDFESWTREKEAFIHSMPSARARALTLEGERLWQGFEAYRPDLHLLSVTANAALFKTPEPSVTADGVNVFENIHKVPLVMDGALQHYFPIKIGPVWVALIPQDFEDYRILDMPASRYNHVQKMLPPNKESDELPVKAEFKFKPIAVDTAEPIVIEGLEMWPMLVEIAHISLWSPDKKNFLWAYDAPWYHPASKRDLFSLYE